MLDDSALRRSLDVLASFFVGHATMSDTLLLVSKLAADAVPVSKFVGLTILVDGRPTTAVFTDADSPEIDQAQYRAGKGPCLDAFKLSQVTLVESTAEPNPWPEFSGACRDHGILSTLSLPLSVAGKPLGAMNLYAEAPRSFGVSEIDTATLFASQASIVLANSQAYWDARSFGEQLSEAMASREVIEQAKGIIMGAMRCSAEEAFTHLVQQSQRMNTKLRVVAQDIVDDIAKKPRSSAR